ncbi:MAG TPA: hypothetical protein PLA88_00365 [Bacteroidales bacterium]|nr:hypothetical protein [Bacteroidales bacterium]
MKFFLPAPFIFILITLLVNIEIYSQSDKTEQSGNLFFAKPEFQLSAIRNGHFDDGDVSKFFGKQNNYCYEIEAEYRGFRDFGTKWGKQIGIVVGLKEYNTLTSFIRYNVLYFTPGISFTFSNPLSEKCRFEIPVDIRANIGFLNKREFFTLPDTLIRYPDDFIRSVCQIKTGVQFVQSISQTANIGATLKFGYGIGEKTDPDSYYNLIVGETGLNVYFGLILRLNFSK